MAIKQETKELIELLLDLVKGNKSFGKLPFDDNHWFRQIFRLYIDGSHTYPGNEPGYKFVERLRTRVIEADGNIKKLTSIAIEMFMNAMAVEFSSLSRSTIQKTIVKHLSKSDLDIFNHHLVDDLTETYSKENI